MGVTFRKIFGACLSIFGFVSAVIDALDWADITKNWPNILPDTNEAIKAHAWFFVISFLLGVAGIFIYRRK
jgi:hypothetical protein